MTMYVLEIKAVVKAGSSLNARIIAKDILEQNGIDWKEIKTVAAFKEANNTLKIVEGRE